MEQINLLENEGHNVVQMWECEWNNIKSKLFITFLGEFLIPWAFVSMFWREKKRICGNFIVPFGDGNH